MENPKSERQDLDLVREIALGLSNLEQEIRPIDFGKELL